MCLYKILSILVFAIFSLSGENIKIGTGGVNGIYYPTGQNICKVFMENQNTIECNTTVTKGSVYNINSLKKGIFNFAIAQSDTIFAAYNGMGSFTKAPYRKLRTVMTIYPELFTFIVRRESKIKKIHDIKGKSISIGVKGSGTRATVEMLFAAAKPLNKKIIKKIKEFNNKESFQALKEGAIDGFFTVIGHPNKQIQELANEVDIDIVNISPKSCLAVKNLLIKNPFLTLSKIPANTYRGITRDVESFGVKATLITTANSDYDTVYKLVKSIVENFKRFKTMHPAYKNIHKKDLIKGLGAPLHPAARDYFMRHGIL